MSDDEKPQTETKTIEPNTDKSNTNGASESKAAPSQIKSIFAPSKLGGFKSLETKSTTPILAPSRLTFGGQPSNASNDSSSNLWSKPLSASSNPFAKLKYSGEDEISSPEKKNIFKGSNNEESSKSTNEKEENGKGDASSKPSQSLFLPSKSPDKTLGGATNDVNLFAAATSNGNSSNGFVFGQNLYSRVSGAEEGANCDTKELPLTDYIFLAASASTTPKPESNGSEVKSLEASSRELQEKESREKRKFDEIEVVTGEETECNVIQMNCKLYGWVQSTWKERGRGILRLNDWRDGAQGFQSRLVVRTKGTLTIMLNTSIWGDMSVQKVSTKSIRFTAADSEGTPKLYLVMAQPRDIDNLFTSLEHRVKNAKVREEKEPSNCATEDKEEEHEKKEDTTEEQPTKKPKNTE